MFVFPPSYRCLVFVFVFRSVLFSRDRPAAPLASVALFHLDFVRDREEEVEILVTRAGVRMAFPLWADPAAAEAAAGGEAEGGGAAAAAGGEAREADGGEGPVFVYGRAGIRLRMEWTQVDGNRPPGVCGSTEGHGAGRQKTELDTTARVQTPPHLGLTRNSSRDEIDQRATRAGGWA